MNGRTQREACLAQTRGAMFGAGLTEGEEDRAAVGVVLPVVAKPPLA